MNSLPLLRSFLLIYVHLHVATHSVAKQPNLVLFVGDDVGAGDLASYGHPSQEWGPLDDMSRAGVRFTQCYSSAVFCTPSRASFLTGRLPLRTGLSNGLGDHVLTPDNPRGLPHAELTLAEALQHAGYVTGMAGKWHLGINAFTHDDGHFLPHTHGFDFVGTMLPFSLVWACDTEQRHLSRPQRSSCFLYRNRTIIEQPLRRLDELTSRLVDDALHFISDSVNSGRPFFLYLPFPQAHTPMFNSQQFRGKSKRGRYGDQVNEMSWAAGRVLQHLVQLHVHTDTLSVFVSDHGPHREVAEEGGSAGFFSGGKGYFTEGGLRVPAIAHWPGTIRAGQVNTDVISLMDLFPTFLSLASVPLPADRHIDGQDISHKLFGDKEPSTRRILYFYCSDILVAVRYGPYKVYFYNLPFPSLVTRRSMVRGTFPLVNYMAPECVAAVTKRATPRIYNVEVDPGEEYLLPLDDHREVMDQVTALITEHNKTLTDLPDPLIVREGLTDRVVPCCNPPYCAC